MESSQACMGNRKPPLANA